MPTPYSDSTKLEARRLFVEDEMNPRAISKHMGGSPVAGTIYNWAEQGEPGGQPWAELRQEYQAEQYEDLSPVGFARSLMDRMRQSLEKGDADSLSKYHKAFRELVDPRYRYGITMEVVTRFLEHIRDEQPDAFAEIDLAELARSFRDQEKKRLGL